MKFNKLIPELAVSDFERSQEFYVNTLGFKIEYARKDFVFLSLQGSQLMVEKANLHWKVGELKYPFGRGINFQIDVKEVTPLIARLKRKGHSLFRKTEDHWYRKGNALLGCREFLVQDPDGFLLRFSQDLGVKRLLKKDR